MNELFKTILSSATKTAEEESELREMLEALGHSERVVELFLGHFMRLPRSMRLEAVKVWRAKSEETDRKDS